MFFNKKVINTEVVKRKSVKLNKQAVKDAKRKIRWGELIDAQSLALYLQSVDARYIHLITEINNSSTVMDYSKIRSGKIAKTRELLEFFEEHYVELERLREEVENRAKIADVKAYQNTPNKNPVDLSKLKSRFKKLTGEDNSSEQR